MLMLQVILVDGNGTLHPRGRHLQYHVLDIDYIDGRCVFVTASGHVLFFRGY